MKNKIISIVFTLILLITNTSFADNKATIDFSTEFKNKNSSYLLINLSNIKNLYALSIDFKYNPKDINVKSIEGGDLIKNSDKQIIELGGETEKEGNTANYQFTLTGKTSGINGSGNICRIEIEYLNNNKVEINDTNMKIKLVGIDNNYEIKEISYNFINTSIQNKGEEDSTKQENSSSEKVEPVIGTITNNNVNSSSDKNINTQNNLKDELSIDTKNKEENSNKENFDEQVSNQDSFNNQDVDKESSNTIINNKNDFNYWIVGVIALLIFGLVFLINKKKNN